MKVPLIDQIQCVKRELGYRERCYPRWVAAGKMTQEKADGELATMRAVLDSLTTLDATNNPELAL